MKFGDKLIELRKKNGYSQEELAEKLGVSRQSVSKWESNNTYPETDKIIQIANLFDCSMDDLINDKITNVESIQRKNRNNVKKIWNSLLEFITNTIDMFSKMKFIEGLKCVIVILLLAVILNIVGIIICNSAASIIANIFTFINHEVVQTIREILKNIFHLVWFIISAIAIIHAFKIKYLNKYEHVEIKKEEKTNNNKTTNEEVVFVKNENEKPFEFLEILAKIVIIFIKIIAGFIALGTIFTSIGLIIATVVLIACIPTNILFLWISLLLLAAATVSIEIIVLLIKFIFNKKIDVPLSLIIFISCIILSGISIGLTALQIKNIELIEDKSIFNIETKEIEINYKDNLVVKSWGLGVDNQYKYIIDNNIEENKIIISRDIDENYFKLFTRKEKMDNLPVIIVEENSTTDVKNIIDIYISNLKKNKLVTFNGYGNDPLVIKANEATINKLIYNMKLLYLVEEKKEDNIIDITVRDDKVHFINGLEGEYFAINDSIKYDVEDYTCKKEIEITEYGERINYICDYEKEDE
ncbi:MAG: helix-turn-helix transcriptional regulator [Bacilli bacterium]|nr:helix-turn-helix transcriptional regulator [Bacilli bacterium]